MRTLIVEIAGQPESPVEVHAELNAFPELLCEGMQLWRRISVDSITGLIGAVQAYEPAVIAFLGSQAETVPWCQWSEKVFPRLFAMPHPQAEDAEVMDAILSRTSLLRRRRLADTNHPLPDKSAAGQTDPQQLMSGIFPEVIRHQAHHKALEWIETFHLAPWLDLIDIDGFERGLSLLGLLLTQLPEPLPLRPLALDIGCHLWSYAPFLQAFLSQSGPSVLTGLELDPWYLQADGRLRSDWARHWASLAVADFRIGALQQQSLPPQDLITLLMPLILPENALRWGIPRHQHDPIGLFADIRRLLKPSGQLLIYLGVELEFLAALELLEQLKWHPLKAEAHLCPLRQQAHGFLIRLHK